MKNTSAESDTRSNNRFKFRLLSQRLSSIHINVANKIQRNDDTVTSGSCHFATTLDKWSELNYSQDFADFYRQNRSLCFTTELVVHNQEKIMKNLVNAVESSSGLSIQPFAELITAIAADLQMDFYKHYPGVFLALSKIIKSDESAGDPDIVECVFNCIASVFYVIWRTMITDIANVYELYAPLLSSTKFHIRRFAAESFAFLIRKVEKPQNFVAMVLNRLEMHPEESDGVSYLLFETFRSIKGELHSCSKKLFPFVLKRLEMPRVQSNTAIIDCVKQLFLLLISDLSSDAIQATVTPIVKRLSHLVENKELCYGSRLIYVLTAMLEKNISLFQDVPHDNEYCNATNIVSFLKFAMNGLSAHLDSCKSCDLINILKSFFQTLLTAPANSLPFTKEDLIDIAVADQVPNSFILDILRSLFGYEDFFQVFFLSLERTQFSHNFPFSEIINVHFEHAVSNKLFFLTGEELKRKRLDFDSNSYEHFMPFFEEYINIARSENNIENLLRCIVFARKIVLTDRVYNVLLDILLENLSCNNFSASATVISSEIIYVIYPLDSSTTYFTELCALSRRTVVALLSLKTLTSLHLRLLDAFLTLLPQDFSEILDELMRLLLNHVDILHLPHHLDRKLFLFVINRLTGYDMISTPTSNDSEVEAALKYVRLCLDAENIPCDFTHYREKIIVVNNLSWEFLQHKNLQKMEELVVPVIIHYLMGILGDNFSLLKKPVLSLIWSYSACSEVLWPILFQCLSKMHLVCIKTGTYFSLTRENLWEEQIPISQVVSVIYSQRSGINVINLSSIYLKLWDAMNSESMLHIAEKYVDFLSPMLFETVDKYEKVQLSGKSSNSQQHLNSTDNNISMIGSIEVNITKKCLCRLIVVQLTVLSKLGNLKSWTDFLMLKSYSLNLLSDPNELIATVAFNMILAYKDDYVLPYREHLLSLLDDKKFRSELTIFSLDEEAGVVKSDHRSQLIPIVLRILYGKFQQRSSVHASKKRGGVDSFKRSVVGFLSSCGVDEIESFFSMVFSPAINLFKKNRIDVQLEKLTSLEFYLTLKSKVFVSHVIYYFPVPVLLGCVSTADIFFDKFGSHLDFLRQRLFKLIALILVYCQRAAELNSEITVNHKQMKPLQKRCLLCLKKYFNFFPDYALDEYERQTFLLMFYDQIKLLRNDACVSSVLMLFFDVLHIISSTMNSALFYTDVVETVHSSEIESDSYCLLDCILDAFVRADVTSIDDRITYYLINIISNLIDLNDSSRLEAAQTQDKHDAYDGVMLPLHIVKKSEELLQKLALSMSCLKRKTRLTCIPRNSESSVLSQSLKLLNRISYVCKNPEICLSLFKSLVIMLQDRKLPENMKVLIMDVMRNLIPCAKDPSALLVDLSQLFSIFTSEELRRPLYEVLLMIGSIDDSCRSAVELAYGLNANSTTKVNTPDFAKRFDAFETANQLLSSADVDKNVMLILIHNLGFFLRTVDDESLRTSSLNTFRILLENFQKNLTDNEIKFDQKIFERVLKEIKSGLRSKSERVHTDFICLLQVIVQGFSHVIPAFQKLSNLCSNDVETDFFENIRHTQVHRRFRALKKLQEFLEKTKCSESVIVNYLKPLVQFFFNFGAKNWKKELSPAEEKAIEIFGLLISRLSWKKYRNILTHYIAYCKREDDVRTNLHLRILLSIISCFPYDLKYSTYKDANNDNFSWQNNNNKSDYDNISLDIKQKATVIHRFIAHSVLPFLSKFVFGKTESCADIIDAGSFKVLQVSSVIGIVKLLKHLPSSSFDANFLCIVLKIIQFLKSRSFSVRNKSRSCLIKILKLLGESKYTCLVFKELYLNLQRGFERHVLVYTVNAILEAVCDDLNCGDLDDCLDLLLKIMNEDFYSNVAEEKKIGSIRGKIMEAKATRSLQGYTVLARLVGVSKVMAIFHPLRDVLNNTSKQKIVSKIQECLSSIRVGLLANRELNDELLLVVVYGLTKDSFEQLDEVNNMETNRQEVSVFKSCCDIPAEPKRNTSNLNEKIKYNKHVFLVFSFQLLLKILKKNQQSPTESLLGKLDPFLPFLMKTLDIRFAKVSGCSLSCIELILKYYAGLPSFNDHLTDLIESIMNLIKYYTTARVSDDDNSSEVLRNSFLVLSNIMIGYGEIDALTPDHVSYLRSIIENQLDSESKHLTSLILLKALLKRKELFPDIKNLMQRIAKLAFMSESVDIRRKCSKLLILYLKNYSLRMAEVEGIFLVYTSNLEHEEEYARKSAIDVLNSLIDIYPQKTIEDLYPAITITLLTSMFNEYIESCALLKRELFASLCRKVSQDVKNDQIARLIKAFCSDERPKIRSICLHALRVLIDIEKARFTNFVPEIIPSLLREIENTVKAEEFLRSNSGAYSTINLNHLENETQTYLIDHLKLQFSVIFDIIEECTDFPRSKKFRHLANGIWQCVTDNFNHNNVAIRILLLQIFGKLMSFYDPTEFFTINASDQQEKEFILTDTENKLRKFVNLHCMLLKTSFCVNLSDYVAKNFITISRILVTKEEFSIAAKVFRKVCATAKFEASNRGNEIVARSCVLKWISGIATYSKDTLQKYLHLFLPVIQRELEKAQDIHESVSTPLQTLANECLSLLKDVFGKQIEKFIDVYKSVEIERNERKSLRKRKHAVSAVTNPIAAAQKKLKKKEIRKQSKKRKLASVEVYKRRKISDY